MSTSRGVILIFGYALVVLGSLAQGQVAECEPVAGVFIESKDLTPAEMMQVRRLIRPTGKEPWLLYGFRVGLGPKSTPRHTALEIYLQPDTENGSLRRGRVLHLQISAPTGVGQKPSSTAKYAQVVVPGRRPDEVKRKWDLQRPFQVDGEFDDETLFGLVTFIRSSPEGPPLPNGVSPAKVNGSLAISHVRRTDNGVEVTLNTDEYHGEDVTLELHNGRFAIVKHTLWIV